MKKAYITTNYRQTQKLGEMLAKELLDGPAPTRKTSLLVGRVGEILCFTGELGSGKTTFAQGVLKGLDVKGPYTSPTFVVMKYYRITHNVKRKTKQKAFHVPRSMFHNVYHIDCYRVRSKDILELGWKEIIADKKNIIIVEWAERIKTIIPDRAIRIKFSHFGQNKRKIEVNSKFKNQSAK